MRKSNEYSGAAKASRRKKVLTSTKHLLLTGVPGVGKTQVISCVADSLSVQHLGGFYTEEIRDVGVRQGFHLRSFDGREWLIAHVDLAKHYRVSKYGVDVAAIDAAAEALLLSKPGLFVYLIDEVGKMECLSKRFISAVRSLLESDKPIIATVGKKGAGFIAEIKQRTDCLLWEITYENRNEMAGQVLNWLAHSVKAYAREQLHF